MAKFEFEKYEQAGCFDEDMAEQLYDAGITPDQAARQSPEDEGIGAYKATAGYKFADGDPDIEEVA